MITTTLALLARRGCGVSLQPWARMWPGQRAGVLHGLIGTGMVISG